MESLNKNKRSQNTNESTILSEDTTDVSSNATQRAHCNTNKKYLGKYNFSSNVIGDQPMYEKKVDTKTPANEIIYADHPSCFLRIQYSSEYREHVNSLK